MRHATLNEWMRRFSSDRRGATAIEYALMAAGIAGAVIVTINALGVKVGTMWTTIGTALH
jgi:pilus assembly protein Flp/PilA